MTMTETTTPTQAPSYSDTKAAIVAAEGRIAAAKERIAALQEQRASMPGARERAIKAGDGPALVAARRLLVEMDDLMMCAEIELALTEESLAEAKWRDDESIVGMTSDRLQGLRAKADAVKVSGTSEEQWMVGLDVQAAAASLNSFGWLESDSRKEHNQAALRRQQRVRDALAKEGLA